MSLIERKLMVQAVAAYLPGAVRRERVENMLRALDAAGYEVVPKCGHPRRAVDTVDNERLDNQLVGAVEALQRIRDKARLAEKDPCGAMAASWVEHVADNALADLGGQ